MGAAKMTEDFVHSPEEDQHSPSSGGIEKFMAHVLLANAFVQQIFHVLQEKISKDTSTMDLSELNVIVNILQRLLSSSQQIMNLQTEICGNADDTIEKAKNGNALNASSVHQLERWLEML
jgi:hypothetical protein